MLQQFIVFILIIGSYCSSLAMEKNTKPKRSYTKTTSNEKAPEDVITKKYKSYYNPQRSKNLFDETQPFKLSRSKLDDFESCQRCFYIDRKLGIGHPPSYPLSLNIAVDRLLKTEFDVYREKQEVHPLCAAHNLDVVPFQHENIDTWRDALHGGIQHQVPNTNIIFQGAPDDIWIDLKSGELFVVDYKATSKKDEISLDTIDPSLLEKYKRQLAMYQWQLRKQNLGHPVSNKGYFVYCNADAYAPQFNNQLNFNTKLITCDTSDIQSNSTSSTSSDSSWIQSSLIAAFNCLKSTETPVAAPTCDHCQYIQNVNKHISAK